MCPTKEFALHLEIAMLKGIELNGSHIPEFVCLLRQLNSEWHKKAGGLFRFPTEPEDDNSPHFFCPHGPASVKFDVHVEQKKIFSDLNFSEALRAFFAITHIGNIHYPEAGEAVAILLQRKLAGINAEGNFRLVPISDPHGSAIRWPPLIRIPFTDADSGSRSSSNKITKKCEI